MTTSRLSVTLLTGRLSEAARESNELVSALAGGRLSVGMLEEVAAGNGYEAGGREVRMPTILGPDGKGRLAGDLTWRAKGGPIPREGLPPRCAALVEEVTTDDGSRGTRIVALFDLSTAARKLEEGQELTLGDLEVQVVQHGAGGKTPRGEVRRLS